MLELASLDHQLRTSRCIIRTLTEQDVGDDYVHWLSDPETNQFLESRFDRHTIEKVERFVSSHFMSGRSVLLGIYDEASKVHIGNIKLDDVNSHHLTAEIGFIVGDKRYRGIGLATEAIVGVSDWAFDELGLTKITAGCYEENIGSLRCLEKAGFHVEARLEAQVVDSGGNRQSILRFAKFSPNRES